MSETPLHRGPIHVKKSPIHGYGVFASKDLAEDELIEECHVLFYNSADDPLGNYTFAFRDQQAIPLGFGCIYNHADQPNIDYTLDPKRNLVLFTTSRPISAGEELFCSYGKGWFAMRQLQPRTERFWQRFYYKGGRPLLRAGLISLVGFALMQGLRYLSS